MVTTALFRIPGVPRDNSPKHGGVEDFVTRPMPHRGEL